MTTIVFFPRAGDDDYDKLVSRLGELNALNKKGQESFHEDRPRKNRLKGKYKEAMEALMPKRAKLGVTNSKPKHSGSSKGSQVSKSASSFVDNVLITCSFVWFVMYWQC